MVIDMLTLQLCCNDPDNGMFAGYIENLHIKLACGDPIELSGPRVKVSERALRACGKDAELIKIGRVTARKYGGATWVGNWCWDSVKVESEKARQIVNYLKARDWSCECAPNDFFDRWLDAGAITADEWPGFVNLEVEA
jgi:hypothetical protein